MVPVADPQGGPGGVEPLLFDVVDELLGDDVDGDALTRVQAETFPDRRVGFRQRPCVDSRLPSDWP